MPRMPQTKPSQSLPKSKPLYRRLWEDSQTKFLAYSQAVTGSLLFVAAELNDAVTSPLINGPMGQIHLPSWFPWFLLGLGALTYLAHGRGNNA
jgi:hypothetical protein